MSEARIAISRFSISSMRLYDSSETVRLQGETAIIICGMGMGWPRPFDFLRTIGFKMLYKTLMKRTSPK